jgi:hypothetical protein
MVLDSNGYGVSKTSRRWGSPRSRPATPRVDRVDAAPTGPSARGPRSVADNTKHGNTQDWERGNV